MRFGSVLAVAIVVVAGLFILGGAAKAAGAISTTRSASDLVPALTVNPNRVAGASFSHLPPTGPFGEEPVGVSDSSFPGFPRHGSAFALLTTGDATLADVSNDSGSAGADLEGGNVRGDQDFDVTVLKIDVDVPESANCLSVDFRFLSEEYPEFVKAGYNDAFVAELDQSTWTTSETAVDAPNNFAFDEAGNPITIDSTGETSVSPEEAAETTYDAATQLLRASTIVTPGIHSLYLSIFDYGDRMYDSAVFLDRLRLDKRSPANCRPGAEPQDPVLRLAERFRPILRLDQSELWRPLAIPELLSERPDGQEGNLLCENINLLPDQCNPLWEQTALPADDSFYLDLNGRGEGPAARYRAPDSRRENCNAFDAGLRDCNEGPSSALYWHAVSGPDSEPYLFLDYWFYYRYNDAPSWDPDDPDASDSLAGHIDDHESDWEGMTVAVDDQEDPVTFEYVAFAQHEGAPRRYLRDLLRCDSSDAVGSCGPWYSPTGERVHAFVASGSHATYPADCFDCEQDGPSSSLSDAAEGPSRGNRRWGNNDDPTALVQFPPSNANEWVDWRGFWGPDPDLPGQRGHVRSPGARAGSSGDRFHEPWEVEHVLCGQFERLCDRGALKKGRAVASSAREAFGACVPWFGSGINAVACDPGALAQALSERTLGQQGSISAEVRTRDEEAIGTAPGLAQSLGDPLGAGDSITLGGTAPNGSVVLLRASRADRRYQVAFDSLELSGEGAATVEANARGRRDLRFTLRNPAGDEHKPALVETGSLARPKRPKKVTARFQNRRRVRVRFRAYAPTTLVGLLGRKHGAPDVIRKVDTRGARGRIRKLSLRAEKGVKFVAGQSVSADGIPSKRIVARIKRR